MPGVDPPLASPPVRPPVEPEPSLAPASTPASERALPALVSQGLRASISTDVNGSWRYPRLLFKLYTPIIGFLSIRGRGDERDRARVSWRPVRPGPLGALVRLSSHVEVYV